MQKARTGLRARIHYTAKLKNGQIVGSSRGGQPLSFTMGRGKVFKGLEQGLVGMKVGQMRAVEVPTEQGYRVRNEKLVMRLDRTRLRDNVMLKKGRVVQYSSGTQEVINLLIRDFDDQTVTVDANHPFAGETLVYEVHLVALG